PTPNPAASSDASLRNARKYFQINCAVCHGVSGMGDGTATKYGFPGINLLTDVTKNRTDGYIFGMIRNGRGLMPTYNRIEERDRWDIVNYVRSLQGKFGAPPDTSHGLPGQTGPLVPGASVSAPTRPAPYFHMVYPQPGTQPAAAAGAPSAVPNAAPPPSPTSARDSARPVRTADSTTQRKRP